MATQGPAGSPPRQVWIRRHRGPGTLVGPYGYQVVAGGEQGTGGRDHAGAAATGLEPSISWIFIGIPFAARAGAPCRRRADYDAVTILPPGNRRGIYGNPINMLRHWADLRQLRLEAARRRERPPIEAVAGQEAARAASEAAGRLGRQPDSGCRAPPRSSCLVRLMRPWRLSRCGLAGGAPPPAGGVPRG
jgi:hypothetical protein